jgi:hypothetical protein
MQPDIFQHGAAYAEAFKETCMACVTFCTAEDKISQTHF